MKESNKLMLQMSLLFLVVFVTFGCIIVNEKLSFLKIPKVTEKITEYIDKNYSNIKDNLIINKVSYQKLKYEVKINNKNNSHLYFYIFYQDKKITDTYKEDYVKGKSIITYQENIIKKNIKKKTNTNYKIKILNTLDKYTDKLKENIINSKNPETLKIYNIESNLVISKFDLKNIVNCIKAFDNNMQSKNIIPKNYTFTIINPEDETIAVKIKNISSEFINNDDFENTINDIINKRKLNTDVLTYEYLN